MKKLFITSTRSLLQKNNNKYSQQIRLFSNNNKVFAAQQQSSSSASSIAGAAFSSTSPLASGDHQQATATSAGVSKDKRESRPFGEGFNEEFSSDSASVNLDTLKDRSDAQMKTFDKSKLKDNVDSITHTMSPGQGTTSTGVNKDVQEEGEDKFRQVPYRTTGKGKRGLGWMASPFDRTFSDFDKNSDMNNNSYKGRASNPNDAYARANWPTGDAGFVDSVNDSTYFENNTKAGPIKHTPDEFSSRHMAGSEAGDSFLPFDFLEHPTTYELVADLPGFKRQNVSVDINEKKGILTVKAKMEESATSSAPLWYRTERRRGQSYFRVVSVPDDVKFDAITAYFKDGQLKITLPKSDESLEGNARAVHVSDDPSVHYGACSGSFGGA